MNSAQEIIDRVLIRIEEDLFRLSENANQFGTIENPSNLQAALYGLEEDLNKMFNDLCD